MNGALNILRNKDKSIKAVTRGVERALVIGDMPFSAYQIKPREAAANARRFIDEAGCQAVKIEWFDGCLDVTKRIFAAGIPVMGHVGLTPQSVESPAGFKVQGKTAQAAKQILANAKVLTKCGVFGIVLECIPNQLAGLITRKISVPTIGIGAGAQTSGQVLVIHDLLGLLEGFNPKFSKKFADAGKLITEGVKRYKDDVESGRFPDPAHSFTMPDEEFRKLK